MDADKITLVARRLVEPPQVMEGEAALRWTGLQNSRTAPIYQPLIREELAALDAPPVVVVSRAAARRQANAKHDSYGRAARYHSLGVIEDPDAKPEAKAAAMTVLNTFVPSAAELNLDTPSEIANARRRAPLVEAQAGALAQVPAAGGRTARDLIEGMVRTAAEREELTDDHPPPPKDGARWLRLWSLMNELRTVLAREVQANPQLPRNLDQLCFGLLDQLEP